MWWRDFRDCHKEFTLLKAEGIDFGQFQNATTAIISDYLSDNLLERLHLVFNCDEAAICLDKTSKKALILRNNKHVHSILNTHNQHVSSICCVSAAGTSVPPTMIFAKGLPAGWRFQHKGHINAAYYQNEFGFVTQNIYAEWFERYS